MQPNIKITLYTVIAVFVGFLAVGTPYTQYYSVGQAYIVEGKADDGELNYSLITADEYERDPLNENPKIITRASHREDVPNKVFYPQTSYRIELWSTDPDSNYGNWLPSGSYVVQDMGTEKTDDDVYMVCHTGKDCRGNKNLEYYLQGETPDLRANLQASLIETAYAAITHQDTAASGNQASVSSYSFSYVTPSATDSMLNVCVATQITGASNNGIITSMTYNGVAMSHAGSIQNQPDNTYRAEQWYLLNPTTGSNTLAVTYTGSVTGTNIVATTYSGVDQTTPIDNVTTSTLTNSGNWNTTITSTTTSAYITDCKVMSRTILTPATFSVASPATMRYNNSVALYNTGFADVQGTTTATTNVWTNNGDGSEDWASVMMALTQGEVATSTPASIISDFIMFE